MVTSNVESVVVTVGKYTVVVSAATATVWRDGKAVESVLPEKALVSVELKPVEGAPALEDASISFGKHRLVIFGGEIKLQRWVGERYSTFSKSPLASATGWVQFAGQAKNWLSKE